MTQQIATPSFIEGTDVSGFQADQDTHHSLVDWKLVCDSGRTFSYIKASEGNTGVDKSYPSHAEGAGHQGLWTGAYHFGHPDAGLGDPVAEARAFRAAAGEQPLGSNLPPALDIEVRPPLNQKAAADWLLAFLAECDQQFQRPDTTVYTMPAFWLWLGEYGLDPRFAERPLWHSQFWLPTARKNPLPTPIKPWTRWALWQYGGGASHKAGGNEATCPGIPGFADLSCFQGTQDEFVQFINGKKQISPPTSGWTTLFSGSLGPNVRKLQAFLNTLALIDPPLTVDGVFGPRTEQAVKSLQTREGLNADGVFGPGSQLAAIRLGFLP